MLERRWLDWNGDGTTYANDQQAAYAEAGFRTYPNFHVSLPAHRCDT